MREHIVNRHVHERGNNIHDGVQHDPRCFLPCSTSNRDASSVFLDKGGHPGVSICTFVLVKQVQVSVFVLLALVKLASSVFLDKGGRAVSVFALLY